MPTIEVSFKDLCSLIGKKLTLEELKDVLLYAKGEVDAVDKDIIKIDIKDTNRPDLWSAEGVAREIKGRITKSSGLRNYHVNKSSIIVNVDKKVNKVRPLTVCAVIKNLKITPDILSQIIQLQEKVAGSFGRNRREVAIGVYDLNKIKSPIKYTTVKPDGIRFIPLDFKEEMTPKEILEKHPKGREFGYLLNGCNEYPIFIDSASNVLSIPPIINSDYTGKVTENTKDLFIECSGFQFKFLLPALNILVTALADRGGKIETVKVVYPDKIMNTPDMTPKKAFVDIDYVNKISGLDLTGKEICHLLEQAGYKTRLNGSRIELLYPAYRQDIMHQRDIVEDVLISFGYNKIEPIIPKLPVVGNADKLELFSNILSEIMIGFGFQEVMTYMLTNKKNLFEKMNMKEENIVEIENPVSTNWNVFRNWLAPCLLEFLSFNKHENYPQKIFEIGDTVSIDEKQETKTRDIRKIACVITDNRIGYEDISSVLDGFMKNLGMNYKIRQTKHPSFISGRVGEIIVNNKSIGVIGEINPAVLNNWNLEKPVICFEIYVGEIFGLIR